MARLRRVGGLVRDSLREIERRLIRPLGQRFRPTRAQRAGQEKGLPPGTEELLVALLRSRLRETSQIEALRADQTPRASGAKAGELEALVHALMAVPPRRAAADPEPSRRAA